MTTPMELATQALAKGSRLFHFLDEPGRLRLAAVARLERYAPGQTVIREGEKSGDFYVIHQGQVTVDADDGGKARRLAVIGEGMFFGEMAAVTNQTRSATVTAVSDLEVLAFDRAAVQAVLKDFPKLRELLGKVGLSRTEDTLAKMMSGD
ncbi:MAG: cyclic nucleotide-binding domain-containing protein [Myxococcaceae bacterium]